MDPLVLVGAVGEDAASFREALGLAGLRTLVAADSLEFLQYCRSSGPQALLLDTRLPWHSPPVVCRLVRARPSLTRVPFFVVSRPAERPLGERCLEAGAHRVVEPSQDMSAVVDMLVQALGTRPAPAADPGR